MLSSILLSMVMSTSPVAVVETPTLNIQEIGTSRGTRRLNNQKLESIETGTSRGTRRLNNQKLESIEIGTSRGTRRL